ncbi:MAG: type II secretion system F family protein [Desulfobacteraceae bacterium]|nr:type II secretion system F family protein [Desulfobacteraceae bacterium]
MMIFLRKRLAPEQRALLFRQLALLCASGMTIPKAIQRLSQRNESKPVRTHCRALMENSPAQTGLEEALDPLLGRAIACLSAKADPNELSAALHEMADTIETTNRYGASLKAALAYPITVFTVCIIVWALLLIFVIPVFEKIFLDFSGALPAPTSSVLAFSGWVRAFGIYLVPVASLLFVLLKYFPQCQTPLLWLFAPLRTVIQNVAAIQFSHLFAALLKAGLPISEAVTLATQAVDPSAYGRRLKRAGQAVSDLESFKDQMKRMKVFPESIMAVVDIVDQTQTLSAAFTRFSQYLRSGFEARLSKAYRTVEISAFLVVALVVGTMVIAMYLPIFKMAGAIGG